MLIIFKDQGLLAGHYSTNLVLRGCLCFSLFVIWTLVNPFTVCAALLLMLVNIPIGSDCYNLLD